MQNGSAICQHFSELGRYEITRGCLPWVVREDDPVAAAEIAHANWSLLASFTDLKCDVMWSMSTTWDRSLTRHALADREDIAYRRTRQMELLGRRPYVRIFSDHGLQQHYRTDVEQARFWRQREHKIRSLLGAVCDITELKLVKGYNGWGRAESSEWPKVMG